MDCRCGLLDCFLQFEGCQGLSHNGFDYVLGLQGLGRIRLQWILFPRLWTTSGSNHHDH